MAEVTAGVELGASTPKLARTLGSGPVVAATILSMGEVWASASAFGPSVFTIRSPFFSEQEHREGNIQSIRFAEWGVTGAAILIGGATTYLTRSWVPAVGCGIIVVLQIGAWEWAIRNPVEAAAAEKRQGFQHAFQGWQQWRG